MPGSNTGFVWTSIVSAVGLITMVMCGCVPCLYGGPTFDALFVSGHLADAESGDALLPVRVTVRTITDGEETAQERAILYGELPPPSLPPPQQPGDYVAALLTAPTPVCEGPFGPVLPPPEFPRPDQVEVIVLRGECEFVFTIAINDGTVVDLGFPDDVIELRDAMLVPACDGGEGG